MSAEASFEGTPADWKISKIGDLATINYGYTESASKEVVGPKFLRITDIQNGQVFWADVPYCKINASDESKHLLISGDIVFARTGATTGKSYLIENPPLAVCASYLIRLRPNQQLISSRYLSYFFQSDFYWQKIRAATTGTAQGGVNASKLSSLEIVTAPLDEQERIVEILEEQLSRLDAALDSVRAVRKKSARFRRSILHAAFTGGLAGYDTSDGTLPDGWVKGTIGHVADVVGGRTPTKFEQRLESSPAINRSVPFYKVGDMNSAVQYLSESRVYFAESEAGVFGIEILPSGTVIFPKAGGAIATNKKRILEVPGAIDLNCMGVTSNGEILPKLLYWFFESFNLSSIADGSVLPQIGKKKVTGIEICYPVNTAEQFKFLDDIEASISRSDEADIIAAAIEKKISIFRRSLLHAAFTGNLTNQWRESAYV